MKDIIARLAEIADKTDFSGVLSIVQEDNPPYRIASGYRDITRKLPMTAETRFGIASGTKTFTALATGTLIDRGTIGIDEPMSHLIPENSSYIAPTATIAQLMNHTSGVFDYYDEEVVEDFDNFHVAIPWDKLETPGDYLPLFTGNRPKFAPGERASYSNGGYVLLGMIIERLTGKLYREYVQEAVLAPAGMDKSGFFAFTDLPDNTAIGYRDIEGNISPNTFSLPMRGGGDGGMYTTAGDMEIFWKRLMSGDIISQKLLGEFLKPQVKLWGATDYGYGIYPGAVNGAVCYSTSGCDAGVGFHSLHLPGEQVTVTILSNFTDGDSTMTREVYRLLSER